MTMIAGMKIHEKEGFSKYGIKKLKNKKSASLYLYKTKGVKMKKYLLLSFLTIVSLGLVFLVIFTFYTEKSKNLSPKGVKDTVVVFCDLMKKEDKKSMEEYVTGFPGIYWQQIYDRQRKINSNNQTANRTTESEGNLSTLKEADSPTHNELSQSGYKSKAQLLETVSPPYLFEQKRYLKKIVRVWEKENQARVEVVLGSPLISEGFSDIPTNFWLYKENDGHWRIFLIQSTVMNEDYAK